MSKNRDEESLVDIYNAGTDITTFTDGVDKQDFQSDKEKLNATLYSIQVIGEATKRLSAEFRQTNSHIPWKKMAGMRDRLVHEYNKTDLNLVWKVAKREIPQLLEQVKVLLHEKPVEKPESPYETYSQGLSQKGLAKAKEVAKNALVDGLEREQVVEILNQYDSAYQDLVGIAGEKTAEKVVVKKAEVELKLKQKKSMPNESQSVDRSKSNSRGI